MEQLLEYSSKHWDLILALVIILAMLVFNFFGARMRGYRDLSPSDAVRLINQEDAWVLDVREDSEYNQSHILDSQHLPLGKLRERLDELEDKRDRPVVVNCRSGQRSANACAILRKNGFEQVYNLRGGIMAWQSANLPLQKPGKRKKRK